MAYGSIMVYCSTPYVGWPRKKMAATLKVHQEITDLVIMATSTWTSHINHGIMDILLCHVCKRTHHHTNQKEQPSGMYRNAIQYISLPAITLSRISQSQVSSKTILIPPEEDSNKILKKKLIRIKAFILEIAKVKVPNDDLWPEIYGIYLLIISNERKLYELQVV